MQCKGIDHLTSQLYLGGLFSMADKPLTDWDALTSLYGVDVLLWEWLNTSYSS